ncbi:MAG: hypothetical protein ACI9LO_003513, partial [Planctomycetota bacterium]
KLILDEQTVVEQPMADQTRAEPATAD